MDEKLELQLKNLEMALQGKTANEVKAAIDNFKSELPTAIKTEFDKEIKSVTEALELKFAEEIKGVKDHANALDAKLQEKSFGKKQNSVASELKEKKAELKNLIKGEGSQEVELKALTNLASVSDNALGFFIPEITQLGTK